MPSPSPLRQVFSGRQLRQTLVVTVLVGSLLNLINQGDALFGGAPLNWGKLLLTFSVPFCVASYGAWSALKGSQSKKDDSA